MPENDFWLVASRASLYLFILFGLWRAWEGYKDRRDQRNCDALINAIVDGQIASVEWGVDPIDHPDARSLPFYCIVEGADWKYLAREGSLKIRRAPHGFVPPEVRTLMRIPKLNKVLSSAGFLLRAYGPKYDVFLGTNKSWIKVVQE